MRDNSTFTYLEHEMSISQTASALYIQRSGLAKRLNTIHKLIPEDWAQLDTRLHDRLYFAMLRRGLVEKPFRQPEQFTLNYYLYFAGHFIFSAQAHMTQSDYVTARCLEKLIVILDGLKEVLRQQKAIGNNLNQLAVLANMGKVQFAIWILPRRKPRGISGAAPDGGPRRNLDGQPQKYHLHHTGWA